MQVFILGVLKPIGINTYEKQGEGCQLWLTKYYKKVSPAANRLSVRRFMPPSRDEKSVTATPLFPTLLPRAESRGTTVTHVTPLESALTQNAGCHPLSLPILVRLFTLLRESAALRDKPALFPIFHFHFSNFRSFSASSTGAATISRTRWSSAGTSSFLKPLVSMVSCR
jgi:hypothetical protein